MGFWLVLLAAPASARATEDGSGLGRWTGESICVGSRPACTNESVVYKIAKPPDQARKVTIEADKIVDGQTVRMGSIDFKYDREVRTLIGQVPIGVWKLTVSGNSMEGTLTQTSDNSVVRRVKLVKEPPSQRS